MASDHRNAQPSDSANHQIVTSSGGEQALQPETSDRPRVASEQVDSATELTSLSTRVRIDGRGHAYGYGSMAGEATTRSSDMSENPVMGSSQNHGAELTKEGPPSYESVVKGRAPIIPESNNCDDVITTQPLSSSTVSQPAVDANLPAQSAPEVDSTTEQLIRDSQSESTKCACCDSCCDCLSGCCDRISDCCDACERCCTSEEMQCFCEVSWKIGSDILNYNSLSLSSSSLQGLKVCLGCTALVCAVCALIGECAK